MSIRIPINCFNFRSKRIIGCKKNWLSEYYAMLSEALKQALIRLENQYQTEGITETDPILFPLRYSHSGDQEITALISALFAYGNVAAIKGFLERIFDRLGPSPAETLLQGIPSNFTNGLYYRFQKEEDIQLLLESLSMLMQKSKGPVFFEELFLKGWKDASEKRNVFYGVSSFEKELFGTARALSARNNRLPGKGFLHLTGDGSLKGAPRKRMMLFLRWMVRTGFPDFGIYKKIKPSELIIPLDVHIAKAGRRLGFTKRKTADGCTAAEITARLKEADSEDPLRFDFFLTRPGITGDCSGAVPDSCGVCALEGFCDPKIQ